MVEWELTLKCNYDCNYCGLLDTSIKPIIDKDILYEFIEMLNIKYPDEEIFLFGGEPFLHPEIEYIIKTFQEFNQPFVIQTNLSEYSAYKIANMQLNFNINISVHPSQTKAYEIIKRIKNIKNIVNICTVDVMYNSKESLVYYELINKFVKCTLTPVSDLGCIGYKEILQEYNNIKNNRVFQKLYNFENIERTVNTITKQRSLHWQDFNNNLSSTCGSTCLYTGNYFLYDPSLNLHNCCYRKTTNGICNNTCFLM